MHMWVTYVGRHLSRTLKKSPCPSRGSNRGPFDLQSSTLPRRYKSRLVPQGSTSILYTYPVPCDIQMNENIQVRTFIP